MICKLLARIFATTDDERAQIHLRYFWMSGYNVASMANYVLQGGVGYAPPFDSEVAATQSTD